MSSVEMEALFTGLVKLIGVLTGFSVVFWIGFCNIPKTFWETRAERLKHREQERTERLHAKFTYKGAQKSKPYMWNPNNSRRHNDDE